MENGNLTLTSEQLINIICDFVGCNKDSTTGNEVKNYVNVLSKNICHRCGSNNILDSHGITIGAFRYCGDCSFMLED